MTEDVPAVSDPRDFVGRLEEADILLFDKIASLHRLVQWADNRPVGHCALWHDDGLYEATIKHVDPAQRVGGVFHTALSALLEEMVDDGRGRAVGLVRAVTAMRFRGITPDQQQDVVGYARDCKDGFAVKDLVLLAPFALQRSYSGQGRPGNEVLGGLIRLCKTYATAARLQQRDRAELFCSELVYRAYQHAGLQIDVPDSLHARYNAPRPRDWGDPEEEDAARMIDEYSEVFESEVLAEPAPLTADPPSEVSAAVARDGGWRSVAQTVTRRRAPEFAEMVTPGDYWSSPSLEPVVILLRSPGR